MARRNPDVRMRELERRAAAGDPEAKKALERHRTRAGLKFTRGGLPLGQWEEVDEETFGESLEIVPPRRTWRDGHVLGEKYSSTAEGENVWVAYQKHGGRYWKALVTMEDLGEHLGELKKRENPRGEEPLRAAERAYHAEDTDESAERYARALERAGRRAELLELRLRRSGTANYEDPKLAAWFYRVPGEAEWKFGNLGNAEYPYGFDGAYGFMEDFDPWAIERLDLAADPEDDFDDALHDSAHGVSGPAIQGIISTFEGSSPEAPSVTAHGWEVFAVPIDSDPDEPGNIYENADPQIGQVIEILNEVYTAEEEEVEPHPEVGSRVRNRDYMVGSQMGDPIEAGSLGTVIEADEEGPTVEFDVGQTIVMEWEGVEPVADNPRGEEPLRAAERAHQVEDTEESLVRYAHALERAGRGREADELLRTHVMLETRDEWLPLLEQAYGEGYPFEEDWVHETYALVEGVTVAQSGEAAQEHGDRAIDGARDATTYSALKKAYVHADQAREEEAQWGDAPAWGAFEWEFELALEDIEIGAHVLFDPEAENPLPPIRDPRRRAPSVFGEDPLGGAGSRDEPLRRAERRAKSEGTFEAWYAYERARVRAGQEPVDLGEEDTEWDAGYGTGSVPGENLLLVRIQGDSVEVAEIQSVREAIGDDEAAEVGFPFWTRLAEYEADHLALGDETQQLIESADIGPYGIEDFAAATPMERAVLLFEIRDMAGGPVRPYEGQSGFSEDVLEAHDIDIDELGGGNLAQEYWDDADETFRVEVLGEEEEEEEEEDELEEALEELPRFTADELLALPVLSSSHFEDLHYEVPGLIRVWIVRGEKGVDYEPDQEISVEVFDGDSWSVHETYEGV